MAENVSDGRAPPPDKRQDGPGDDVPVFVDFERDDGLDVEDVLRAVQRAHVEVGVVLERHGQVCAPHDTIDAHGLSMNDTITSIGGRSPPGQDNSRRLAQNFVRPLQRTILALELAELVAVRTGQTTASALVEPSLTNSFAQGLRFAVNFARNRAPRRRLRLVLPLMFKHQPHGSLADLQRIPRRFLHDSIPSKMESPGIPGRFKVPFAVRSCTSEKIGRNELQSRLPFMVAWRDTFISAHEPRRAPPRFRYNHTILWPLA